MKPVLWIHKASGRIRFNGEGLPDSWMPLYSKEELELDPMKSNNIPELTEKTQRVWDYIKNRKTSFEAGPIANHFFLSQGTMAKHLHTLYTAGLLTRTRKGNKVFWTVKYVEHNEETKPEIKPEIKSTTMAVSKPPVKNQPSAVIWPSNPYKTSYPNIRGYDD